MKRALVLGGGGAKGAYQCGVWRCLREKHQNFDLVVGTSIGALNGAMVVQNKYQECLDLWENINVDMVLNNGVNLKFNFEVMMGQKDKFVPMLQTAAKKKGMDTAPLHELIKKTVDYKKIKKSKKDFYVMTVEVPNFVPYQINVKDLSAEKMVDFLMASASCFPAFPIKHIEDKKYVDGGYFDNLPINTAIEQKADEIIAVNLKSPGLTRKPRPNNKVIKIIEPYWSLGGLLNFDSEVAKRNIILGYYDAKKLFGDYRGFAYTFKANARYLKKLLTVFEEKIATINEQSTNRLLGKIAFELNDADYKLLTFNERKYSDEDCLLRLIERIMELMDYSPEELYNIKKVGRDIADSIKSVEKMDVKKWLKRFMKNPAITIKEFEAKNLIFSLAEEIDSLDSSVLAMFYKVFPSECLTGLLISCLPKTDL